MKKKFIIINLDTNKYYHCAWPEPSWTADANNALMFNSIEAAEGRIQEHIKSDNNKGFELKAVLEIKPVYVIETR